MIYLPLALGYWILGGYRLVLPGKSGQLHDRGLPETGDPGGNVGAGALFPKGNWDDS